MSYGVAQVLKPKQRHRWIVIVVWVLKPEQHMVWLVDLKVVLFGFWNPKNLERPIEIKGEGEEFPWEKTQNLEREIERNKKP